MIRRVAFKKAIVAGVIGAVAWEAAVRGLIAAGLPMFDLVYTLGTLVPLGEPAFWKWWAVGMLMHAVVGAIWAIFYAYFFWSLFDRPPALQGMLFSLLPAALAGLIMVPQMDHMHWRMLSGETPENGFFANGIGWLGPVTIIVGHLVYGGVMGSLYKKPVGYPAGRQVPSYG
jgi:hypothetical protein